MTDSERDMAVDDAVYLMEGFLSGESWPDTMEATRALARIHPETLRLVREVAAHVGVK